MFSSQLWQEISEENGQVQDIMSTLENFQLDTTPAKPSNHEDNEIRPVHVEQRYCTLLFTSNSHLSAFLFVASVHLFSVGSNSTLGTVDLFPVCSVQVCASS